MTGPPRAVRKVRSTRSATPLLPQDQQELVDLVRVHGTVAKTAEAAGLKVKALYKRLERDPVFHAAFREARSKGAKDRLFNEAAINLLMRRHDQEMDEGIPVNDNTMNRICEAHESGVWSKGKITDTQGNVVSALDNLPDDK